MERRRKEKGKERKDRKGKGGRKGGDRRGGKTIDGHKRDRVDKVFMKLACTAH